MLHGDIDGESVRLTIGTERSLSLVEKLDS